MKKRNFSMINKNENKCTLKSVNMQCVMNNIVCFAASFCLAFATRGIMTSDIYSLGWKQLLTNKEHLFFIVGFTAVIFGVVYIWRTKLIEVSENLQKRESNLELCRVICMFLVIIHHCVVHGGIIHIEGMTTNKFLSFILIPGGKLSFVCFIAISCWFLVDQKFRMKRFLQVWLTAFFYSVAFAIVSSLMGTQLTWRNWFSVFLPIAGNSHGFAASYLGFYLLIPFLNKLTENITKKQARLILLFIFYFETGTQIIGYFSHYYQPMPSELFVFILCYLLALNLKRWPLKIINNKSVMLCVFISIWLILWLARYYFAIDPTDKISQFVVSTMYDEYSISNIVGGFALFFFFKNLNVKKMPLVNALATGTLGVLLIHDHNFFRYNLWGQIMRASEWYSDNKFVLLTIMLSLWIFGVCFVIDRIRAVIIERSFLRLKWIQALCDKYDDIF